MKKIIAITLTYILIASGIFVFDRYFNDFPDFTDEVVVHETTPTDVVRRYCDLAGEGSFDQIPAYTTYKPEAYEVAWWRQINEYSDLIGKPRVKSPYEEEPRHRRKYEIIGGDITPNKTNVDKYQPAHINRDAAYIDQIENEWIYGEQARIRVKLRSHRLSRYLAEMDFLLYRENGEWKIIDVDNPEVVNIYGVPPDRLWEAQEPLAETKSSTR